MKIKTRRFGEIEIDEDKIISMPVRAMLGFPDQKKFVLIEREETRPFCWYQSIDTPDLAMVVIDPFLFRQDYSVDISPAIEEMSWKETEKENFAIYTVVNFSDDDPPIVTANLIGPIIINIKTFESIQMVIADGEYSHQERVV